MVVRGGDGRRCIGVCGGEGDGYKRETERGLVLEGGGGYVVFFKQKTGDAF